MQKSNKHTVPSEKSKFVPHSRNTAGKWQVIDAQDQVLGRLCSRVVNVIKGKNRADYAPHYSNSSNIVIINAASIKLTGKKERNKSYLVHPTNKPGEQKKILVKDLLVKRPQEIIMRALKGMLPKNALGYELLKRIRVFATDKHPHEAQVETNDKR